MCGIDRLRKNECCEYANTKPYPGHGASCTPDNDKCGPYDKVCRKDTAKCAGTFNGRCWVVGGDNECDIDLYCYGYGTHEECVKLAGANEYCIHKHP